MADFLADSVLDAGLQYIITNADRLDICTTRPTTYTEATSTYTKGNKTSISVGSQQDGASGRKVQVAAITDGTVTGTDTVAYYALSDVSGTELIATGALSASQAVTSGNTFTLGAIDITIPDAA